MAEEDAQVSDVGYWNQHLKGFDSILFMPIHDGVKGHPATPRALHSPSRHTVFGKVQGLIKEILANIFLARRAMACVTT
jgi:hypothetical protein